MIEYKCQNSPEEILKLLNEAETRANENTRLIGSDELMAIMHSLETKAMQFKKQGGDAWVLRRVDERLQALCSQLMINERKN